MSFTFVTPPRLVIGWAAATDGRLAAEAKRLGVRPLIIAGKSLRTNGMLDKILDSLTAAGLSPITHEGVPAEPTVDDLQAAMDAANASRADGVLAIGGGSVLDVAKGAAALMGNRGQGTGDRRDAAATLLTARDYFSGAVSVPDSGGLPILAVPTTAGTGSEATWVTVLVEKPDDRPNRPLSTDHRPLPKPRKASIRGGAMMPAVALLDAELTVSCPPSVTAYSGMDAFVQAVEAFTSSGANPLTDALAFEAALLTGKNLRTAFTEPGNQAAREAMLLGSFMAGVALNTSRLGLVHGLAHPIGAVTGAAHGLLCGLLMPPVMRFNRDAAKQKYERLAAALDLPNGADGLIAFTEKLLHDLNIPTRLSEIGLNESDIEFIAKESQSSGSTKANPRPVTESDAAAVTSGCW